MENSILNSVKKVLGLLPDYTEFDDDILMHINSAFSTLQQLGVGPKIGYMIQGPDEEWSDYLFDNATLNNVKTYVFLKVRVIFDPPQTSYLVTAFEKQISELEWRLNVNREEFDWVDPDPVVIDDE